MNIRLRCLAYRPDHNGECCNCDEPADAHLADGLYRVTTAYLCAGFAIEDGVVLWCAPILRARLAEWVVCAVRIAG